MFCLLVSTLCATKSSAHGGGGKGALDPLKLELQMAGSYHVGARNWPSARAVSTLNHHSSLWKSSLFSFVGFLRQTRHSEVLLCVNRLASSLTGMSQPHSASSGSGVPNAMHLIRKEMEDTELIAGASQFRPPEGITRSHHLLGIPVPATTE